MKENFWMLTSGLVILLLCLVLWDHIKKSHVRNLASTFQQPCRNGNTRGGQKPNEVNVVEIVIDKIQSVINLSIDKIQ